MRASSASPLVYAFGLVTDAPRAFQPQLLQVPARKRQLVALVGCACVCWQQWLLEGAPEQRKPKRGNHRHCPHGLRIPRNELWSRCANSNHMPLCFHRMNECFIGLIYLPRGVPIFHGCARRHGEAVVSARSVRLDDGVRMMACSLTCALSIIDVVRPD